MKKIIIFVFLFVAANAAAQNIPITDTVIRFGVTQKGRPDGVKSEVKIDKEGGTIQSSDGKVELIFPEGAVTKKTTISIQPVTNSAPNSNGKAYQMEPSGINFHQQVQIIFHYRDKDTEGSLPDLMGIAMQDDKGRWSSLDKVALDTVSKTLSSTISHFSFYVNYLKAKINPSSAKVKVNGSLRLKVTYVSEGTGDDELLTHLGVEINTPPVWSANGIPKGDNVTGLISASQNFSAIYKAPALVPDQNPVAVAIEFKGSLININGKQFKSLKLVSNILVYGDAWEVKMVASIKGGSPAAWGGYVTNNDDGSFIVSLEKKNPAVIGINNTLEQLINNCSKTILNPTTCTGILHVAGTRSIKVTPANPPGQPNPIVEIWFTPYPIELTRFKYTCPPPPGIKESAVGKIDLSQMAMLMFYGKPAIPQYLKFEAKDGEQVLMENGEIGGAIYYKIWVTKIRGD